MPLNRFNSLKYSIVHDTRLSLQYMCLQINLLARVNFIETSKFKMESELFGLLSLLVGVLFGLLMEISNRRRCISKYLAMFLWRSLAAMEPTVYTLLQTDAVCLYLY